MIKFKKNESFYIRDGWFEKAINSIEDNQNIFYKNDGVEILGIGSNMVKGLKYWLKAANVIESDGNNQLSEFGKLIKKYDSYLDKKFSWYLIHYFLVRNREECPIFYEVFNSDLNKFEKTDISNYLMKKLDITNGTVNKKYLEADLNVFLKSYVNEEVVVNPEDNYVCPLSALRVLKKDKSDYCKEKPRYTSLSPLIIYYVLAEYYKGKSFNIEESFDIENSPIRVFNLDKFMYLQYLDDLRNLGYFVITKTAGLNTVDFVDEKVFSLSELFEAYFGGTDHVQ